MKPRISKIQSSPKVGIANKAPEGDVTTTSTISPQVTPEKQTAQLAQIELMTAGQRRVNLVWESTQALIAVIVTVATIYSAINGVESLLLGNAFTLIIALYFVRQNHTKTGGVKGTDNDR